MGEVIVTFRVMPEGVDVNLDELEKEIKEKVVPQKIERLPIAFGLTALKVVKLVPEESGKLEEVENTLKSLPGVSGVEVLEVTRSL